MHTYTSHPPFHPQNFYPLVNFEAKVGEKSAGFAYKDQSEAKAAWELKKESKVK